LKDGNYVYVASNISDAVQIIDVSTPTSPTAV
jgi:YVTN family beta-propeller protein